MGLQSERSPLKSSLDSLLTKDSFYRYISPKHPTFKLLSYGMSSCVGIQEAGITPVKSSGNTLPWSSRSLNLCKSTHKV